MKRLLMDDLLKWKDRDDRMPLIIDKALKKSEEDIAQGKTGNARSYIKDKISDLEAMTHV